MFSVHTIILVLLTALKVEEIESNTSTLLLKEFVHA